MTVTRVLEAVAAPSESVRFIDQIVQHAPSDISFRFFSWRYAFFGKYDILHLHWPEFLVRDQTRIRRATRRILLRALMLRLSLRRTRIVRTVHNLVPHTEGDGRERRVLAELDSMVSTHVVLNECTQTSGSGDVQLIRHGDYREQFASMPRPATVPGRVLFFGRIESYKRVAELIRAAEGIEDERVSLRVVGRTTASTVDDVTSALARQAESRSRTSALLEFVSDEEMVAEISRAEIVILPYSEMHNSGVALVALSLDKPIAVPRSCTTEALAEEVGAGWVHFLDGELSAAALIASARFGQSPRDTPSPRLEARDWHSIADAYAGVFRRSS